MAFAFAKPVLARSQTLSGRWMVTGEGVSRPGAITLTLEIEGKQVTGRHEAVGLSTVPVTGKAKGSQVVLRYSLVENGREVRVEIKATLSADRLDGRVDFILPSGQQVTLPWIAIRGAALSRYVTATAATTRTGRGSASAR